ncbi:hypothetical protein [Sinorhizobium medicae]|uniref:hypothetical protein n=2 Tax=Sinorhizobium medicae TaxID=110321 RepID=UPI00396A4B42
MASMLVGVERGDHPICIGGGVSLLTAIGGIPWPNLLLILVAFVGITGFLAQERRSEGRGKTGRGDGVMFSTPRLLAAAAALAMVVAVVVWIYRQGGDEVIPSIERQNNKLAALRTMSALALTFVLQGCGVSAPASAACLRRVVDDC